MRIGMALSRPFARSAEKGAETLVWLADSEEASAINGGYCFDMRRATPTAEGQDQDAARRLWQISEQQVAASAAGAA
jgi:hypothetical protein